MPRAGQVCVPGEAQAISRVVRGYLGATAVVVTVITALTFLSPAATQMSPIARVLGAGALLSLQVAGVRTDWERLLLQGRGQLGIDALVLGLTFVNTVQPMVSGPDSMTAWGIAVTAVFAGVVASNRGMLIVLSTIVVTSAVSIVRFAGTVETVVPITTTVLIVVLGCLSWFAGRSFRAAMRAHHRTTLELRANTDALEMQQAVTIAEMKRLESLREDLVATVSHELRTPLTVILGLATTLNRPEVVLEDDQRADLMNRLERNAVDLQSLVSRLLDFDRLGRTPLVVAGSAHLAAAISRATADADLGDSSLVVDIDGVPPVHGTEELIARVIAELVTNAGTHAHGASMIRVTAATVGDAVRVTVADDGPGLPPLEWGQLSATFGRGGRHETREARGLGLGLPFCVRALAALGTRLELDVVEQGASLSFVLPCWVRPEPVDVDTRQLAQTINA